MPRSLETKIDPLLVGSGYVETKPDAGQRGFPYTPSYPSTAAFLMT